MIAPEVDYKISTRKLLLTLFQHENSCRAWQGTTYILKKSMTSGDKGEAPEPINRTRPPSFSLILLKTNLSHMGDGFLPEKIDRTNLQIG